MKKQNLNLIKKITGKTCKLAGGVAVIRAGASTGDRNERRSQASSEDALAAMLEWKKVSSAGGGFIYSCIQRRKLATTLEGDEKTGANIILKALEAPLFRSILQMQDLEGSVIINKVRESGTGIGLML